MTGKRVQKLRVVDAEPTEQPEPVWQEIATEINQLLTALAGYGIDMRDTVDPRQLRPRIEGFSACRMLVLKGICTEEEMHVLQLEAHRELLRGILQAAEQQRLQAQQDLRKVVVPESPKGLVIAKH